MYLSYLELPGNGVFKNQNYINLLAVNMVPKDLFFQTIHQNADL